MTDLIEKIGKSLIQHGKFNDRIYLIKYDSEDIAVLLNRFDELIEEYKYTKIFVKISIEYEPVFALRGFIREAVIPCYYNEEACVFMAKYFSVDRKNYLDEDRIITKDVLKTAMSKYNQFGGPKLTDEYKLRILEESGINELGKLYKLVFESYPFPIFDSEYLAKTMNDNVVYYGIYFQNRLIAASSAEIDSDSKSVEMTDFAVLPEYRGKNKALALLASMELDMAERNIRTCYTIARSLSYGMNISFSKAGYRYGGTLVNNTNISGKIESMNVWYKNL